MQLGVLVAETVADAFAVARWRDLFHLEWFPACCADDAKRAGGETSGDVEEDAAGVSAGILEGIAEIRDGDSEEIVVERADDRSRVGIRCICRQPRGELRFSVVVAKDHPSVFGVSHGATGAEGRDLGRGKTHSF